MSNITERLDNLKKTIQEDDFLQGKGLSNEVNIRMFCYNVKEEMAVRYFTEHLSNDDLTCNVQIVDLYETFLSICEDKRILDRIPQLEQRKGKDFLERQFEKTCNSEVFAKKIVDIFVDSNDLLLYNDELIWFKGEKINNPNTHGTGCTLSSAIASNLALGYSIPESIKNAKSYISECLRVMLDLGKGSGPLDHMAPYRK